MWWWLLAFCVAVKHAAALKFAYVLPLSGRYSTIGKSYYHGYSMAFHIFEKNGGLFWRGVKQNITFEDDVYGIDDTTNNELGPVLLDNYLSNQTWTEEEPIMILGGYGSSSIVHQIAVTDKHKVLMINGGGASEDMYRPASEGGQNTNKLAFGLLSPVSKMAKTTLEFMRLQMDENKLEKPCRIALIWEDSSHGYAYRHVVTRYSLLYPEYFELVYAADFPYPTREKGFESMSLDLFRVNEQLKETKGRGIDALLADVHSGDFIAMQNSLSHYKFDFSFVTYGARGTDTKDIESLDLPGLADKIISAQWWSSSLNNQQSRRFIREWRLTQAFAWADEVTEDGVDAIFSLPKDQIEVNWYGALGFQAALVLLQAINSTGVQTKTGVQEYLQNTTFASTLLPGGMLEFDEYGQATNDYTIVQANVEVRTSTSNEQFIVNKAHTLFPMSEGSGKFMAKANSSGVVMPPCSEDFVKYSTSGCNQDGIRVTTFYWSMQEYPCPDPQVPCGCSESNYKLPADLETECEYVSVSSSQGTVIVVFSTAGAFICLASLVFLLWHYNHVVMKAGQREFLAIMCFAGVWCNLSAASFLGPNVSEMCMTRVLYLLLSVTLLLGSLTVKVYRIYKIWNNSSMKRIVITAWDMFKVLLLLMLGILIIFSVWAGLQAPHAEVEVEQVVHRLKVVNIDTQVCVYFEDIAFPVVAISYMLFILLYCNVLSFQGRNSAAEYMESRSIMFASYCMTFIMAMVIVLVATAELPNSSQIMLISLTLVFTSLLFVGLVLGPKIYFATQPSIKSVTKSVQRRLGSARNSTYEHRTGSSGYYRNTANTNATRDSDDGSKKMMSRKSSSQSESVNLPFSAQPPRAPDNDAPPTSTISLA